MTAVAIHIINFINGINLKSSINKKDKEEIKQKLMFIQKYIKKESEKNKLTKIIDIFNKGRLHEDDKK